MHFARKNWVKAIIATTLGLCLYIGVNAKRSDLSINENVSGIDANSNGIRDDIDRFIESLPVTTEQKNHLSAYAFYIQLTMVITPLTREKSDELAKKKAQAQICAMNALSNRKQGREYIRQIETNSINTYQRKQAYDAYNKSRNGTELRLPSAENCPVTY